jgi:hypothetical protein
MSPRSIRNLAEVNEALDGLVRAAVLHYTQCDVTGPVRQICLGPWVVERILCAPPHALAMVLQVAIGRLADIDRAS